MGRGSSARCGSAGSVVLRLPRRCRGGSRRFRSAIRNTPFCVRRSRRAYEAFDRRCESSAGFAFRPSDLHDAFEGCRAPANAPRSHPACAQAWQRSHGQTEEQPLDRAFPVKKILFITHLHPDLVRGGARQSCYELFDEFRNDPDYDPVLMACAPKWACGKLFVHRNAVIGYDRRDEYLYLTQKYDTFWHSSTEMKVLRDFARFLESFKPDVIHFQHYLFAGLEAVQIARKTLPHAKIVMTMHEFTPICHSDGQMVKNQTRDLCVKDSPFACHECFPAFSPSAFARRRKYILEVFDLIDHFVMPSHFLVERYRAWGLPAEKISFIDYGR